MENKLPQGHSWVQTDDGSLTLFSETFQEACHSTSGARAETLLHYVQGCKILEKTKVHERLVILEVGFGLGIGFLSTLEALPSKTKFHFISLELDKNLLDWFKETQNDHAFLKNLSWDKNLLRAKDEYIELTIIQGDARKALPEFLTDHPVKWHAIYQDAFSPKRNPILWTQEWFELLKFHSHPDVTLSTYSASNSIRKSLVESGWKVSKGEKFGPKRTSTRASLKGQTDPDILFQLERSPVSALRDLNLDQFTNKINS